MNRETAKKLRAWIVRFNTEATDAEALDLPVIFPVWKADTLYSVNDRVRYNDILYRCLTEHKSQDAWTPLAAASLWTRVLIENPDIIPEWIQPESTNPYAKGDKVTHNGIIYVSNIDTNVWEPGVFGWDVVTE